MRQKYTTKRNDASLTILKTRHKEITKKLEVIDHRTRNQDVIHLLRTVDNINAAKLKLAKGSEHAAHM